MKMKYYAYLAAGTVMACFVLTSVLRAQQQPTPQQPVPPQEQPAGPQASQQAVSQTGLLPVYGVDLRFDPAWVDGTQFPSQSADFPNGVNAAFQQVWEALKSGGFSALRFPIDISDAPGAANGVANLCLWAKNNNIKLVPVLTSSAEGQPVGQDYPAKASAFVKALVAAMRAGDGKNLDAYTQLLAYQHGDEMNHAGRHGGMSSAAAQQLLLQAARELRKAERDSLNGTGLDATPQIVSASFDYELVRAGAMAGGMLTDDAYNQAYKSLAQFLAGLAGSADIELLVVDWFAGSVGAGGVEKYPALLRGLAADLPGKQVILTTGFSTAFRTADEQKRLYALAFANLGDFRASAGVDCPFIGVFFREALNGKQPNPDPPRPNLPGEMAQWDWSKKAPELASMWTERKPSADMTWWLKKVENNMGLVSLQSDASGNTFVVPQPAAQGLSQIAGAVSEANAAASNPYGAQSVGGSGPAESGTGVPGTGQGGFGFKQNLQGKAQQGLLGLLDGVFQRLGGMVGGAGSGTPYAGTSYPQTSPSGPDSGFPPSVPGGQPGSVPPIILLTQQDVTLQPPHPQAGQPVTIKANIKNTGPSDAVALMLLASGDDGNTLGQMDHIQVARNSAYAASLQWTPTDAKASYGITLQVGDASGFQLASVSLNPIAIAPAAGAGGAPPSTGTDQGSGVAHDKSSGSSSTTDDSDKTKTSQPLGSAKFVGMHLGGPFQRPVAGQSSPLMFEVTNPYGVPMEYVTATLKMDGRVIESQTKHGLVPQENHSFGFFGVPALSPGVHEFVVILKSKRVGAKAAQMGSVTQKITVSAVSSAAAGRGSSVRSITGGSSSTGGGPAGGALTKGQPAMPPRSGTASAGTVRSILPSSYRIGQLSVPSTPVGPQSANAGAAGGPSSASGPSGNSAGPRVASPMSRTVQMDLGVSATDIRYTPLQVTVGQPVTFSVTVHNLGTLRADGVRVVFQLFALPRQAGAQPVALMSSQEYRISIPGRNEPGRGVQVANWPTSLPAAGQLQVVVTVTASGDGNPSNKRVASIYITGLAKQPPRRIYQRTPKPM